MSVPELRQMRYFVAVAEERHFGRAAARLRIAQPGLSQQIKALERILGTRLLTRDRRGTELTPAGEVFLEHSRLVLELAERAVDSARLAEHGARGIIKVGRSVSGIQAVAVELLDCFRERHPEVLLELHPGYAPENLERLTRRTLDAAIVMAPFEPNPGIKYQPLGISEVLIAVPEGHPLAKRKRISRSELLQEPFLDVHRTLNPPLVDHLRELLFGTAQHPRLVELEDVELPLLMMVGQGQGISASLFPANGLNVPGVEFRRLEPPTPRIEYGLAWAEKPASPFAPLLVELALEVTSSAVTAR